MPVGFSIAYIGFCTARRNPKTVCRLFLYISLKYNYFFDCGCYFLVFSILYTNKIVFLHFYFNFFGGNV